LFINSSGCAGAGLASSGAVLDNTWASADEPAIRYNVFGLFSVDGGHCLSSNGIYGHVSSTIYIEKLVHAGNGQTLFIKKIQLLAFLFLLLFKKRFKKKKKRR
jgi:hypothetical protein